MSQDPTGPETRCAPHRGRAILRIGGDERVKFLQDLVTQDMGRVHRDGIGYAALLTPQGKLIADFLLVEAGDAVLIDVAEACADDLARRLTMFKLRAAVEISRDDRPVTRGLGPAPEGALADPRDPALGWRLYGQTLEKGAPIDWDALRIAHRIPETGLEAQPGESFILELGFERLNGVDFRKGCYVGQEVTARMHHKTDLRRGLRRVSLSAPVPPGTPVTMADGRDAGTLWTQAGWTQAGWTQAGWTQAGWTQAGWTQAGGQGLALMRLDRIGGTLTAGGVGIQVLADA